jgi:hypothetical protein
MAAAVVLKNNSVNANKRHWHKAGQALAHADRSWLGRLITHGPGSGVEDDDRDRADGGCLTPKQGQEEH